MGARVGLCGRAGRRGGCESAVHLPVLCAVRGFDELAHRARRRSGLHAEFVGREGDGMNEATWIEKMRAVEGTLYHVTCAMLREEYDRRDAMQETALRAWEKQSTLRREEYFGTWAVRICINVCKDIRRKSKPIMSTDDVPEIPAPQGDTDFRLMLDNLPDTLRLPVVLYYLDGLTVAETAQALGVPVGTVKFRLHQARKKLRVELDAPEGEGANVQ
ncbi:MAG TPA: RNA polymerase subunit sigma [Clostridiales bacterium]|nr:RNA polymerase subunit sigma [Clostridiales bacterium]HCJ88715.1 RNA polymerase subunit sigma [Clostridiales bacterium]